MPGVAAITAVPGPQSPACCGEPWDCAPDEGCAVPERRFLESDRAFPRFVGPISNPILAKDPRSLTEARLLFINDQIPPEHPLGAGDFQVLGLQVRAALTERLTFIADKDGFAWIHPSTGRTQDGWLDIAVGLKYLLVRDIENQLLLGAGIQYEPQTGEKRVFQNQGHGVMTGFVYGGKEFGERVHLLGNFGYQFGLDPNQNSSFLYGSLHLDYRVLCRLYPLVELNWFHYTDGGDRGLPPAIGEGDDLLNLGTSGVAGNDLVTLAAGLKAIVNEHLDTGVALEFPLTNRRDLLETRLLVEMIFRY
jgi:hypothetical protein